MDTLKKYEVIRLIEHDGRCHVSMDQVQGRLLADWLKETKVKARIKETRTKEIRMNKEMFYIWMKQLAKQLEQYHRSGIGACYRYLNPYSIVIGEDDKIWLLDLAAEENEFVLKSLQERGMREQFVRPIQQIRDKRPNENKEAVDIYCYGKTMQLLFMRNKADLELNRSEERHLERFLCRCVDMESPKLYKSLSQMQKEVPRKQRKIVIPYKRQLIAAGSVLIIALAAQKALSYVQAGQGIQKQETQDQGIQGVQTQDQGIQGGQTREKQTWEEQTDQAIQDIYRRLEQLEEY